MLLLLLMFFYLYLFDVVEDSRSSSFNERWDNMIQTTSKDPLEVLDGSITRSKAK
jgi:hypothetical protein